MCGKLFASHNLYITLPDYVRLQLIIKVTPEVKGGIFHFTSGRYDPLTLTARGSTLVVRI